MLSDISVTIPRGKLTVVIGPIGSGKSTLLSALLNETVTLTGTGLTGCGHPPRSTADEREGMGEKKCASHHVSAENLS